VGALLLRFLTLFPNIGGAAWRFPTCARPTRAFGSRALREHRRSSASIPLSAELIPRIALFDRPVHCCFELLQPHVLRIAHG